MPENVAEVFRRVLDEGVEIDEVTLVGLIFACA